MKLKMKNCGVPGCTNQSIENKDKSLHQPPTYILKMKNCGVPGCTNQSIENKDKSLHQPPTYIFA